MFIELNSYTYIFTYNLSLYIYLNTSYLIALYISDTLYKDESDPSASPKSFLLCDYNRDGDSYRSPWSNTYFPPLEDGILPSKALRKVEIEMNELVKFYTEMYYEGGISSVYLWENDEEENGDEGAEIRDFAGCVCIKKDVVDNQFVSSGKYSKLETYYYYYY